MNCPVCDEVRMKEVEKDGVHIDVCPQCKGVWLDRGELEKLLEGVREMQNEFDDMANRSVQGGTPNPAQYQQPTNPNRTQNQQPYQQHQPYSNQPPYQQQPYQQQPYQQQPYSNQQPYQQPQYPNQPQYQQQHQQYPNYQGQTYYGKKDKNYPKYKKKKSIFDVFEDLF